MKPKDVALLGIALVVLVGVGLFGYAQLGPKKGLGGKNVLTVEVIKPISPEYDKEALTILSDAARTRNFTPPVDLNSGLGNNKPFNPL